MPVANPFELATPSFNLAGLHGILLILLPWELGVGAGKMGALKHPGVGVLGIHKSLELGLGVR